MCLEIVFKLWRVNKYINTLVPLGFPNDQLPRTHEEVAIDPKIATMLKQKATMMISSRITLLYFTFVLTLFPQLEIKLDLKYYWKMLSLLSFGRVTSLSMFNFSIWEIFWIKDDQAAETDFILIGVSRDAILEVAQ